jgi:hypothetical protein
MPSPRLAQRFLVSTLVVLLAFSARADVVVLHPAADTSLIQVAPDSNLGGADFFNAGTAGNGNRNRGLMQFNLSETIPFGSVIDGVWLSLDIVREPSVDILFGFFGLHRMLASWGEGTKIPFDEASPGTGSPATEGEATWRYRFADTTAWTAPGGARGVDFIAVSSSITYIAGIGDESFFESSPEMVADAQFWLEHPDQNFGWALMPEDEILRKTARSFASREDAGGGPSLIISFTPVPEPTVWTLGGMAALALISLRERQRRRQAQ